MQKLADGSIQLNGYTQITSVANTSRDGIAERLVRLNLGLTF